MYKIILNLFPSQPYPAEDDVELVGTQATDYAHVTARIAEQTQDAGEDGQRQHRRKYVSSAKKTTD